MGGFQIEKNAPERSDLSRQAFFILGMHRSGTSFLAHALSMMGLELPVSISAGAPDNPKGHFESLKITQFNDELLSQLGVSWDTFVSPPESWSSSELVAMAIPALIEIILTEFPGDGPFVLKDPRLSLLLPLWKKVAKQADFQDHYIISIRHPSAVAASLDKRNKISKIRSCLIWLNHVFSAEEHSRGEKRSFVCFPQWTGNFAIAMDKLENDLGTEFPGKFRMNVIHAEAEFERSLVHHEGSWPEAERDSIEKLCVATFCTFQKLINAPGDAGVLTEIDALREEFRNKSPVYAELFLDVQRHKAEELKAQLADLQRNNAELEQQLGAAVGRVAELERHLDMYRQEREQTNAQIAKLKQFLKAEKIAAKAMKTDHEVLLASYQKERLTVLRPIGRNVYRRAGPLLRRALPADWVDAIKRLAPDPDGIPKRLTYQPQPGKHLSASCHEFEAPTVATEPDIFVLSIINWDFRYQRPQHIAKGLADCGRRVFYVEMQFAGDELEIVTHGDKLFRVRLSLRDVGYIQPYTGRPNPEQTQRWVSAFHQLCSCVKATSFTQIVIQHPYWWQMARHLSPEFQVVFDCMDDISGFSNTEQFLLDLESDLLSKCDKLIVSSRHLLEKYAHHRPPTLIRNAAEITHFAGADGGARSCSFLKNQSVSRSRDVIRVGYVGAIAEWFDTDLVREVALSDTGCEFHLCGAVSVKQPVELAEIPNIFMHGEIPYSEVPGFIQAMDVMIIPFKILPIIQACDPVKFYEYSAMGKPTVSTALPELARASHLALFASTPEEFSRQIHEACKKAKDPDFVRQLIGFAAQNTWEHRCRQFISTLMAMPKVSVIILSYGDPELTKSALYSLFDGGANYPNMEVLVVDNGSATAELEAIKRFAAQYPDVTVLENGENLGFARGNNVGLKAASGDYVMLLNNDTVVAPGAINAMVSHLVNNAHIGAVGPLTNNIGNEAKLFVEYEDIEQMKDIARQATTGYRGVYTPINVLGYFAVMFRRRDLEVFGLLAEDYGRGMFEDDDHCAMIKLNGFLCALAEDAYVHHHLSATFSKLGGSEKETLFEKNRVIFETKWGPWQPHKYRELRPESSLSERG